MSDAAASRPCPYNPDELSVLRKFAKVTDDITACRFIRDLPKYKHRFSIEAQPDGSCRTEYPNYDSDDFIAFLTHYRKLVANGESTNIFAVMNIIKKYASDDERAALKEIKKILVAEGTKPALQLAIGTPGNETNYPPKEIENVLFNGQVFHTADELQNDLRKILDFEPLTKMSFIAYAVHVASQAKQIAGVLKQRRFV